jgi:hypothetical protein
MAEMVVKILIELLSVLTLVIKQIRQGKPSKSVFGEVLFPRLKTAQKNLLRSFLEIRTSRR